MIRQFKLINSKNVEFDLQNFKDKNVLLNPSGLGFGNLNQFLTVSSNRILVDTDESFPNISGTIFFGSYVEYEKFLVFLEANSSEEAYTFTYQPPNQEQSYQCLVYVGSVSKTEFRNNRLEIPILLNRITRWFLEQSQEDTIDPASEGKTYPYTYPYTYGGNVGDVTIVVDTSEPIGLEIEISGETLNPILRQFVDGVLFATIDFTESTTGVEKIISDSNILTQKLVKVETDGSETNLYLDQSKVDFTKQQFFLLQDGINRILFNNDLIGGTVKLTFREERRGV